MAQPVTQKPRTLSQGPWSLALPPAASQLGSRFSGVDSGKREKGMMELGFATHQPVALSQMP